MDFVSQLVIVILAIALTFGGMDIITRIHPLTHRAWRQLLRYLVLRPLRWVLRQSSIATAWLRRWSTRQLRQLWVFLGRLLWRGIRWIRTRLSTNSRVLIGVVMALAILIPLGVWSNQTASKVAAWRNLLPLRYLWWELGIGAVVAIVIWLYRAGGAGYARGMVGGGRLGRSVTTLVEIVVVGVLLGLFVSFVNTRRNQARSVNNLLAATASFKLVPRTSAPARISIPPGWRWDMVKPVPTGWTTDNGYLDAESNRIQVFEVVPPATEVTLEVALTKCTTPQMCAW